MRRRYPCRAARLGACCALLLLALPVVSAETADAVPRLIDLGARSCIPCRKMAPILDALREEYAGRLKVSFIDVAAASADRNLVVDRESHAALTTYDPQRQGVAIAAEQMGAEQGSQPVLGKALARADLAAPVITPNAVRCVGEERGQQDDEHEELRTPGRIGIGQRQ